MGKKKKAKTAHEKKDRNEYKKTPPPPNKVYEYTFEKAYHPLVGELTQKLNTSSVAGMLDPDFIASKSDPGHFGGFYETGLELGETFDSGQPKSDVIFPENGNGMDFDGEPYSNYNWELLFHFPLTIAVHLSKNQRFAEAQRWFHMVFNPLSPDGKYWRFAGFQGADQSQVAALMALLAKPDPTGPELEKIERIQHGIEAIQLKPFQPHAVAQTRPIAYQYSVVMKYLDNQIAWGDSLFRQDTIESINEATQHYVLAANILGARPQPVPSAGTVRPQCYEDFQKLDAMGNVLVDLEAQFPFNLGIPADGQGGQEVQGPLAGIGRTLYFCVPRNQKMLAYWDLVGDRLFKIRNSMNIEGVVRQLALFDPPIDPGMLVKAAAAGIDIGSIVAGTNQPIGPVRAVLLIQKALELCSEVKAMGGALLSAIEKGDAEAMSLLRQGHEAKILRMTQDTRFLQWKQAQNATEGLLKTRASALERYAYYQRLLGQSVDSNLLPASLPLDRRQLTEENFDEAYAALVGQYDKELPLQTFRAPAIASSDDPGVMSGSSGAGQLYLNSSEDTELNWHMPAARDMRLASGVLDTLASVLVLIPDFEIDTQFWGIGASTKAFGGDKLFHSIQAGANLARLCATWESDQAGMAGRTAGHERRAEDWFLQSNLAARELMQVGRQLIGSLIAEQIAHREYLATQQQIANAQEVEQLMHDKFSNQELYGWMQGELSRLYYQYYRFAFDTARQAEKSMKRELMRPELAADFVRFNYWDAGRKGLLSGEALYLDVKRMELAYHENNRREYELTKHVSLRQLDPAALLSLKATGKCQVTIPEWLYSLDCPGHYLRRIKSVSLSIPAVAGPYTGVNCTLTLLKSTVRKSPLGDFKRKGSDDDRFADYFGSTQAVVTSAGSNDSGLFETNLRDERILPFEGAGAESTWKLELPAKYRAFDYNSISDVVLHVRYTAREGGETLAGSAVTYLDTIVKNSSASGLSLLLGLKNDLSVDWGRFLAGGGTTFETSIKREHFPYLAAAAKGGIKVKGVSAACVKRDANAPTGWKLTSDEVQGLNFTTLDNSLANNGSFALSLTPGANPSLVADPAAWVFLIVRYALG